MKYYKDMLWLFKILRLIFSFTGLVIIIVAAVVVILILAILVW